ncbi:MAG: hypothetical protein JXQ90_01560 [Cyclobacteriaceae bacterium]
MKKLFAFVIITAVSIQLFSQDYDFKVLANRGENKIKKENGEVITLKSGAKLTAADKIETSDRVYLGLMHHSGKTIELKEVGTFNVADLLSEVMGKELSTIGKYAQMISDKMTEGVSQSAKKPGQRSLGAKIEVMLLEDTEVYGNEGVIRWYTSSPQSGATYVLEVKDILDDVIFTTETTQTNYTLNFDEIKSDMGLYIVTISKKGDEDFVSGSFPVKKLQASELPDMASKLSDIKSGMSSDSPLELLMLASFYEENGLFLDALTTYEAAIEMSPDVEDFQELYQIFLGNNGLR